MNRLAIAISSSNLVCILVTVNHHDQGSLAKCLILRLMVPEGEFTTILVGVWQLGGARTVVESLQCCHR